MVNHKTILAEDGYHLTALGLEQLKELESRYYHLLSTSTQQKYQHYSDVEKFKTLQNKKRTSNKSESPIPVKEKRTSGIEGIKTLLSPGRKYDWLQYGMDNFDGLGDLISMAENALQEMKDAFDTIVKDKLEKMTAEKAKYDQHSFELETKISELQKKMGMKEAG